MRRRLLAAVFLLLLTARPLFALDPFEWEPSRNDPRSYPPLRERYQEHAAVYDYPAIFRDLQEGLEHAPVWTKTEPAYQRLLEAFRVLNGRFSEFEEELAAADEERDTLDLFLSRYPTGLFQFPCPDGVCFSGKGYQITYEEIEALPDPLAEDLLYRMDTVQRFLTDFKKPAIRQTVRAIENARLRWEVYMREGMSQFPWEAAFNSWTIGADDIQFPPLRQWILLHPELGVAVSTNRLQEMTAKESLSIELLGHLWYRWKNVEKPEAGLRWWGLSAVAALRDDLRPGIGLLAHYGRFVTVRVTWHDADEDGRWFNDAPFILFGIDLFRFAENRVPAYQKKWEKALELRGRLLE